MGLGLGEGEAQESPRIIYFRQTEHWPERQSLGVALPGWGSRRDGQGRPRDPGITALMAQDFSEKSWLPYWVGKGTMGKKEREFPAACPGPVGTEQGRGCTCCFFPPPSYSRKHWDADRAEAGGVSSANSF